MFVLSTLTHFSPMFQFYTPEKIRKTKVIGKLEQMGQHIKPQSCHHTETSQLICSANQLTGFYMMATSAFNELKRFYMMCFLLDTLHYCSIQVSDPFLGFEYIGVVSLH